MAIARPAHRVKTACTYDDGTTSWVLGDVVDTYQDVDVIYAENEVFPAWVIKDGGSVWACGPAQWVVSGSDHLLELLHTIDSVGSFADEDACTVAVGPMPAADFAGIAAAEPEADVTTGGTAVVWSSVYDPWGLWDDVDQFDLPNWCGAFRVSVATSLLSLGDATEYTVTINTGSGSPDVFTLPASEQLYMTTPLRIRTVDHYKVEIVLSHDGSTAGTLMIELSVDLLMGYL